MLLQIFMVLQLVTPMKICNFTANMWVSALRALDIYPKVTIDIAGEGQNLLHVKVLDRFVQLAACVKKNIYIYI